MGKYKALISLVGDQSIPNLLPVLCLQPRHVVLVCTEQTEPVAERLRLILQEHTAEHDVSIQCEIVEVDPYDMADIETETSKTVDKRAWMPEELAFNLTGGTKTMAIAAYRLAESYGAPFCYLVSEGNTSRIHTYRVSPEEGLEFVGKMDVPTCLDIDLYLKTHLGDYEEESPKNEFEKMVYEVLRPEFDEIKASVMPHSYGNLEIDLVLRLGNNVAVVEVKCGGKVSKRRGIEQLVTAGEARFLGAFTKKSLVLDRQYGSDNLKLAEAHEIAVIQLPSAQTGRLSAEDERRLVGSLQQQLGA